MQIAVIPSFGQAIRHLNIICFIAAEKIYLNRLKYQTHKYKNLKLLL